MLGTIETILEWIAIILISFTGIFIALEWVGYLIYRRNHKDDEI